MDIDRAVRGLGYLAGHYSAGFLGWTGGLLTNEAKPVGDALLQASAALEFESQKFLASRPPLR